MLQQKTLTVARTVTVTLNLHAAGLAWAREGRG
jgi:hypothetical protein